MGEMTKWSEEEKQTWAVSKLLEKQKELGRLPHKDDFDVVTLSRIKAFLGTWPHALVKAGLKEAKPTPPKKKKRSRSAGTAHETEPFRLERQKQKTFLSKVPEKNNQTPNKEDF